MAVKVSSSSSSDSSSFAEDSSTSPRLASASTLNTLSSTDATDNDLLRESNVVSLNITDGDGCSSTSDSSIETSLLL